MMLVEKFLKSPDISSRVSLFVVVLSSTALKLSANISMDFFKFPMLSSASVLLDLCIEGDDLLLEMSKVSLALGWGDCSAGAAHGAVSLPAAETAEVVTICVSCRLLSDFPFALPVGGSLADRDLSAADAAGALSRRSDPLLPSSSESPTGVLSASVP